MIQYMVLIMLLDINYKDCNKLHETIKANPVIRVKNHHIKTQQALIDFGQSIGQLLKWDFGYVNDLVIDKEKENYLYSNESVPFHWDGAFHTAPHLLIFHCIKSPQEGFGGETLFSNSQHLYEDLTKTQKALLADIELEYQTEKKAYYGGTFKVKPIEKHPKNRRHTLRFAEPVYTAYNPVSMSFTSPKQAEAREILQLIAKRLYQKPYCYQHTWQDDELIIADNHALLHGRNAFNQNSCRHIRRIQVL